MLVDFWASWCAPCRQSFPWMTGLYNRYSEQGLVIVAINVDKKRQPAYDFLVDFSPPFTVAFDPLGKTAEAFHVEGMPSSFVIGRDGVILYSHIGFDQKKTGMMEELIQEGLSK